MGGDNEYLVVQQWLNDEPGDLAQGWHSEATFHDSQGIPLLSSLLFSYYQDGLHSGTIRLLRLNDAVKEYSIEQLFPALKTELFKRLEIEPESSAKVVGDYYHHDLPQAIRQYISALSRMGDGQPVPSQGAPRLCRILDQLMDTGIPHERQGELVEPRRQFLANEHPWYVNERCYDGIEKKVSGIIVDCVAQKGFHNHFRHEIEIEHSSRTGRYALNVGRNIENGFYMFLDDKPLFAELWESQEKDVPNHQIYLATQKDYKHGKPLQQLSALPFYDRLNNFLRSFMTLVSGEFREQFSEYSPQYVSWEEYCSSEFGAEANIAVLHVKRDSLTIEHGIDLRQHPQLPNSQPGQGKFEDNR
ncbi:MAG: hypothetical protein ABIH34_00365 [Nanoarchaeota archaeon]